MAQLGTIIRNLETLYGPYPGKSTGVIVDTVPSGVNYALETQDRSFFPSAGSVDGNTLIHELVHQWYGNNVAPTTWTDIWIGEGMATWGPTFYNTAEGFGAGAMPTELTYFNSWNNAAPTSRRTGRSLRAVRPTRARCTATRPTRAARSSGRRCGSPSATTRSSS